MYKSGFTIGTVLIFLLSSATVSWAQYSGGFGTEAEPYQIGIVADWQDLMDTPTDWDKHFILTADIDLQGVLLSPVGSYSNKFTGVFDGNDHIVRNADVNMPDSDYVGLFGYVGHDGQICNTGVEDAAIAGDDYVGGLVGRNYRGSITACYATGSVSGSYNVGGLVGESYDASITACYATGSVTGDVCVGGLVGYNYNGSLTACYATGSVTGSYDNVGGLVGINHGSIKACYATIGPVEGYRDVGGLVGANSGTLTACYSTGSVSGSYNVGGFAGSVSWRMGGSPFYACFWDVNTSDWSTSAGDHYGGLEGKTTAEMQDPNTFLSADWDFTDQDGDPADWFMPEDDYPQLAFGSWVWAKMPDITEMPWQEATAAITDAGFLIGAVNWVISQTVPVGHIISQNPPAGHTGAQGITEIDLDISLPTEFSAGSGSEEDPYQIRTASEWALLIESSGLWGRDFILMADIDFQGLPLSPVGNDLPGFSGVLDGNGHIIRNVFMTMPDTDYVGLFSRLCGVRGGCGGRIENVGVEAVSIIGDNYVGALVGGNGGSLVACYATIGPVEGVEGVGGLVGGNDGSLTACYATGSVEGYVAVGGLVGGNHGWSSVITACFWDKDSSGWTTSDGGVGKTTAEMKTLSTFTSVGWDFVGETANGTEDIWSICEGTNYPRLTWQIPAADWLCPDGVGLEDFSYLGGEWQIPDNSGSPANLDGDEEVGFGDVMMFCELWLAGR